MSRGRWLRSWLFAKFLYTNRYLEVLAIQRPELLPEQNLDECGGRNASKSEGLLFCCKIFSSQNGQSRGREILNVSSRRPRAASQERYMVSQWNFFEDILQLRNGSSYRIDPFVVGSRRSNPSKYAETFDQLLLFFRISFVSW